MGVRRWTAVSAAAVLALSVAACGDSDTGGSAGTTTKPSFAAGTTMDKLAKAGKITVGTKFDQPGFGLKGLDGTPAGFDVEIAKAVAAELGIPANKIEYKESQSAVREQVIEQGTVDLVVATYTINAKRKERVDFAGPYYVAGQALMVRNDDTSITGPDSFKDGTKKVCSVTGSTPASTIKQYLKSEATQLVQFGGYPQCVDALKSRQVDAVTTDNVILAGYIATNEGLFKLAGQKFTQEPYGIGVKKGDTAFRDFINDALTKLEHDGRYEKAWRSTVGKYDPNVPTPPPVDRY
jgi:glutamate transport system substrate-binding protein